MTELTREQKCESVMEIMTKQIEKMVEADVNQETISLYISTTLNAMANIK